MNSVFPECIGCSNTVCPSFLFSKPECCPDYHPSNNIRLYHGSRTGLSGNIQPISRDICDFGKSFYMGVSKLQPASLVAEFPTAVFYELSFDIQDLKVLFLKPDIDWAMLVAYNRQKIKQDKCPHLYQKYKHMTNAYDVIIGYIADDKIYSSLDAFFRNRLSMENLIKCLSLMKLGMQVACKTQKACDQIIITSSTPIGDTDYASLLGIIDDIKDKTTIDEEADRIMNSPDCKLGLLFSAICERDYI